MNFIKRNWFIFGIFLVLTLGILISEFGIMLNRGAVFSTVLVVLLFFITGLKLPVNSIKSGLKDIRLHIYIQLFIFAVVPLYFYFTSMLLKDYFAPQVLVGIYALACLPATISSCIVFTQSAGGNVVATMFNAAFSNLIGVIISPLLLSLMLKTSSEALPVSELVEIFRKLALMMLLPIGAGAFMRRWLGNFAVKQKRTLAVLANLFILFILFFAFSKSAGDPEFTGNLRSMAGVYGYLAVSFIILLSLASAGAAVIGFSLEDRISVAFTAPKKTLAMGVPLLSAFFDGQPELLGIALLPLIFYHPWQLFVSGILQEVIKKRKSPSRS
ncbi:MAG: bile acid:sodium symporter [Spirochaetales bacterium]|nr:bile acid:sodium symporter [Spirochaetales bacterium]